MVAKHCRSRGWRYRGQHFDKPLTVEYLVKKCKPKPKPRIHLWDSDFVHLGEITQWVMWYGDIPGDADPSRTTCTVTIDPPVSAYSLDSLMELRREKYEGTP